MAEFTERHETMLSETHDATIKIQTALLGAGGSDKGLIGKVNEVCSRQDTLDTRQDKIEGSHKTLVGLLIGSGVLGGSVVAGISRLIGG